MAARFSIVADGYGRAAGAIEVRIRAEVAAEYAVRLEQASTFWQRFRLRREMTGEIRRLIHEKAPPYGLY